MTEEDPRVLALELVVILKRHQIPEIKKPRWLTYKLEEVIQNRYFDGKRARFGDLEFFIRRPV